MRKEYKILTLVATTALCFSSTGFVQAFEPAGVLSIAPVQTLKFESGAEQNVSGAQGFVNNMAQRAIGFLGEESITEEQRKSEFRRLLHDSFDMQTIGRFALGRYWKTATAQQRSEYQKLFENMIVEVYSKRFNDYNGQALEVRSAQAEGKDTVVQSFIVPESGPEIQVDWRVRHKDGRYKIVDVIVEGVSMALTQRSDFASVIQRGGGELDILLAELRK